MIQPKHHLHKNQDNGLYYQNETPLEDDDEDVVYGRKRATSAANTGDMEDISFREERQRFIVRNIYEKLSWRDKIVKWRYSIIYSIYLVVMSLLALFLFIWAIYKRGRYVVHSVTNNSNHQRIEEVWFLALEGVCTFLIVYECFLSIFLYRKEWVRTATSQISLNNLQYKKIIVWCNILVSLAALVIFSLLLYCFIEREENYFWNDVAFAQEALIVLHCVINGFRIFVYLLQ